MFKKILSTAAAFVIAVGCAFTSFADDEAGQGEMEIVKTEISAPQKIVFLGDSIPAGYGLADYVKDGETPLSSYPALLEAKYNGELSDICKCSIVNCASSGDTSSKLWQKVGTGSLDLSLIASDVVVVSIGGNDIMGPALEFIYNDLKVTNKEQMKKFDTAKLSDAQTMQKMNAAMEKITENISTFKVNINKIISAIHEKTKGTVIVQTVYNPLDSDPSLAVFSGLIGAKIQEVNNAITSNSSSGDYLVCDVAGAFAGKSKEYTNIDDFDIHPNADGHKAIADLMDQQIKKKKYEHEELKEVGDSSSSGKKKISKGELYLTLGLFFGGFLILIVVVTIIFRKKTS